MTQTIMPYHAFVKPNGAISRSTPVDALPELLTAEETAVWLGISKWSTYDLCRRGVLPTTRLGRHVHVRRSGLALMAGRESEKSDRG